MATLPEFGKDCFQCPHCGVTAKQNWANGKTLSRVAQSIQHQFYLDYRGTIPSHDAKPVEGFLISFTHQFPNVLNEEFPQELDLSSCQSCGKTAIWVEAQMVFPRVTPVETPNADLDPDIAGIYDEAARIVSDSPKGAAALLRLALQKVMVQVGEGGKDINGDIKNLVAKGLSPKIQKALDLLRVAGNNAVHPGEISFEDNADIALSMFRLLNLIAEEMITRPREIDDLYDDIVPESTKEQIEKRDETHG